jgi:hypothetical protein
MRTRNSSVPGQANCLLSEHISIFWNPGQQMQKTLQGLLQTLLYHVLQAHPELVAKICPGRWSASSTTSWTIKELQKALTIRYRPEKHSTTLDLDRILLHAVGCTFGPGETYSSCFDNGRRTLFGGLLQNERA